MCDLSNDFGKESEHALLARFPKVITDRLDHSWTSHFDNEKCFFPRVLMKNHLFCESYLGFHRSGWIVLIKSEILIMTGMVWPVSSDKWKAPCVWSSSIVSDCDLITVT